MFTALPFSWYYHPDGLNDFQLMQGTSEFYPILISGIITLVIGLISVISTRSASKTTTKKEGYLIVTFSWIAISLYGSLPFYLSGYFGSFTDAFFETISGFTTTGATILNDIESIPHGLLFWRSLTHWIGGMGIIVLSLAILPLLGIGGMQLFSAEAPGPTTDKIHPKVKEMAKRLSAIYVLLTFALTGLLILGNMSFFDAICHAFATMATGGFSTQNASIAAYSSTIQYIIIVFMILAGANFSMHYFMLKRKFSKIKNNEEYQLYIGIIIVATILITAGMIVEMNLGIEQAFRDSLFQVVSIITTTGFVTSDYLLWPSGMWMLLFILFFVGGSAGSTGGGVKVVRILVLIKNSLLEFRRLIHPQAIIPVRLNHRPVSQNIVFVVISFFLFYLSTFAIGAIIMTVIGLDFMTAVGVSASALGNIGPALGSVGPVNNYALIPDLGKWVLSFLMLLGRLEIFTVLIIFSPAFWRK
ncbi:MAG: TrkH family potassium uptake protein [Bacteroidales bacterium]|nr:TrkH family potassium uptake protein [Bacteroidales bacterium]